VASGAARGDNEYSFFFLCREKKGGEGERAVNRQVRAEGTRTAVFSEEKGKEKGKERKKAKKPLVKNRAGRNELVFSVRLQSKVLERGKGKKGDPGTPTCRRKKYYIGCVHPLRDRYQGKKKMRWKEASCIERRNSNAFRCY